MGLFSRTRTPSSRSYYPPIQPRIVASSTGPVALLITLSAAVKPEKGCPTRVSIQNVELNVRFFPFREVKRGGTNVFTGLKVPEDFPEQTFYRLASLNASSSSEEVLNCFAMAFGSRSLALNRWSRPPYPD
jgi:hypothetical protein